MSSPEPETIDELMDRIHNEPDLTQLTANDIEALIAYHRANREGGLRPNKGVAKAEKKIDLVALSAVQAPTTTGKVYRR